ncbi:lipase member H-like [Culex pipiens pallens]|uniref:lipase member H-like n=1 Tax=Culex pipiens pallens TaxID=42434 RepID=UPI0022AB1FD9|nr:lipase member H-like [Culex pipiens pallens]
MWSLCVLLATLASMFPTGHAIDLSIYSTESALASFIDTFSSGLAGMAGNLIQTVVDNRTIDQEVTFWCGRRGYSSLQQTFVDDSAIGSKLDLTKSVAIITHGWQSKANVTWVQEMAGAYSKYVDSNVCVVDWSRYARYGYAIAAKRNTRLVGKYLAVFMQFLTRNGITPSKMTLIGHSLGAHVSAFACKNFSGQVKELYGLDAAGPLFTLPIDVGTKNRIASTDAGYVQMIYTTRYLLGTGDPIGQANFFPNGGYHPQPSCLLPMLTYSDAYVPLACSHSHSHQLFTLSLNPAYVYKAKKCGTYPTYLLGLCLFNSNDVLGIYSKKSSGNFYFNQKVFYPFV